MTPESGRRPMSPVESRLTGSRGSALSRSRYSSLRPSIDFDTDDTEEPQSPLKPSAHRSLLLLLKSKAVQTEPIGTPQSILTSSPLPRVLGDQASSHDGHSESSTLADANPSVVGALIERAAVLLNRMVQADALTLTTRLKRQNLLGADVSHLSRSTVNNIISESNALRTQFRAWLEDDKITTTCARRDLRALFKLFKDMFTEIGQLRVTLNDVILDPSVAGKVSEMALHPSKSTPSPSTETPATSSSSAWMAPLSKLLGLPGGSNQDDAAARALSPPARPVSRGPLRPPPRVAPKREAALSASAMTVNVEFSGAVAGRAVATTSSAQPGRGDAGVLMTSPSTSSVSTPSATGETSRSVMDIFAGAPRPQVATPADPWVVVPKPHRATSLIGKRYDLAADATMGRAAMRNAALNRPPRLPRAVDAVIDGMQAEEERSVPPDTLLQRTLKPRGLSDSSIRTTFLNQEEDAAAQLPPTAAPPGRSDRQSVLQTLSRKMQSFRLASSSSAGPSRMARDPLESGAPPVPPGSAAPTLITPSTSSGPPGAGMPIRRATQPASSHGGGSFLPKLNLSSLAATLDVAEIDEGGEPSMPHGMYISSAREELNREWRRGL
jgi:hypothetical protein